MITEIKGYVATCDYCGREMEAGDFCGIIYETEAIAIADCKENGWQEIEPDKLACDECVEKFQNKEL